MNPSMSTHPFILDALEERHLRLIADADFRFIELWGGRPHFDFHDDAAVRRALGWLRDSGLQTATIHLPFYSVFGQPGFRYLSLADQDDEARRTIGADYRRLADLCAPFGCDLLILHPLGGKPYDGREIERLRRELDWFAPYCAERGVRIALENIMQRQTRTAMLAEICRAYGPTVGICLDAGHAQVDGGLMNELADAAGHLFAVHAHDNHGQKDEHLLPGQGLIDWPAVFAALTEQTPEARYFTFELMPSALGGAETDEANRALFAAAQKFWQAHHGEPR
jgi:sugar phosphate isomerase/epimerase